MHSSLEEIKRLTGSLGPEPLGHDTSTLLDTHLNSFYHNLAGALDNLAWMLLWELGLADSIDEGDYTTRRFCNLFRKEFLVALSEAQQTLAEKRGAEVFSNWYTEIRALRDPIAHRIPLTFARGVLTANEGKEYKRAYARRDVALKASSQVITNGLVDEANRQLDLTMKEMNYAESLGKFVPVVITSEESGNQIRSANEQLLVDYRNLLEISHGTLDVFLA